MITLKEVVMLELRLMGLDPIKPRIVGQPPGYEKPHALILLILKAAEIAARRTPWGHPDYKIDLINSTHYLTDDDLIAGVDQRIAEYQSYAVAIADRLAKDKLPDHTTPRTAKYALEQIEESMPFMLEYQETWHNFMSPT